MTKLVLVDGNAILHRAYHAIPQLTDRKGRPTNAVYGFTSMLLGVISGLQPTHLAVCFDRPEPTFREREFAAYQAHRPETDKGLISQFSLAREVLKAMNIAAFEKAGFEADDVIGTIARRAIEDIGILGYKDIKKEAKKTPNITVSQYRGIDEVIIVTGDGDLLQLVNDRVKLYMPISGFSAGKLMGIEETKAKMGIEPELIPDYKGLIGDASDNYKGVAGIGPKTAVELLSKYKSIKEIYKKLNEIPKKTREKLEKDRENAFLSHKLATIVKNVPIEFEIEKTDDWSVANTRVLDLFNDFGFKSLIKRIEHVGRIIQSEKQMALL